MMAVSALPAPSAIEDRCIETPAWNRLVCDSAPPILIQSR